MSGNRASAAPSAPGEAELASGLAAFQAGDFGAAIAPLAAALADDPDDLDAALLLGIAYYRTGDLARAEPLLARAEASPDERSRASARVFLGLIADARDDEERARAYFEHVARSTSSLGVAGRRLLERDGVERWSVTALGRVDADSNVPILPATVVAAGGRGGGSRSDVDLTLVGAASARPFEGTPLVLDDTLSFRAQARLTAYDMLDEVVGAAYVAAWTEDRLTAADHLEETTLGGKQYDLGNVIDLAWRHQIGRLAVGARYALGLEHYAPAAYTGYSGAAHVVSIEAAWGGPTRPLELALAYLFERDVTDDPALGATANGARATIRLALGPHQDVRASLFASDRLYGSASLGRHDEVVEGDVVWYVDLGDVFGLALGFDGLRNASNVADYDYAKWIGFGSLLATWR